MGLLHLQEKMKIRITKSARSLKQNPFETIPNDRHTKFKTVLLKIFEDLDFRIVSYFEIRIL